MERVDLGEVKDPCHFQEETMDGWHRGTWRGDRIEHRRKNRMCLDSIPRKVGRPTRMAMVSGNNRSVPVHCIVGYFSLVNKSWNLARQLHYKKGVLSTVYALCYTQLQADVLTPE